MFGYAGDPVSEYSFDIFPGRPFVVDENDRYLYAAGAQKKADRDAISRFELE